MRPLALLLLFAAALVGCGGPEGTEGEAVSVDDLNKNRAATTQDDGVAPPKPPSDSVPGGGK